MVVEAVQYNAANLEHYVLHAFVVMPNHVPLLTLTRIAHFYVGHSRTKRKLRNVPEVA